jgi:hypothetical protein
VYYALPGAQQMAHQRTLQGDVRVVERYRRVEVFGAEGGVPGMEDVFEHCCVVRRVAHVRTHRAGLALALAEARTCYDHLAGRLGVELRERLITAGALTSPGERDQRLTSVGERLVADLGVDLDGLTGTRRIFARDCNDWTHRRPHLAGALPAALVSRFLALEWLSEGPGRALKAAECFDRCLDGWLDAATTAA